MKYKFISLRYKSYFSPITKLAKEKKDSNWIIEKKSLWMDYREKEENPTNEFDISDLNIECLKQEEIQKVFSTFSDQKRSVHLPIPGIDSWFQRSV